MAFTLSSAYGLEEDLSFRKVGEMSSIRRFNGIVLVVSTILCNLAADSGETVGVEVLCGTFR
ncbi:hypothetical protein [Kutzneria buriramensis]|nr:hypothetical protein [Kutzneria buriramensis]